MEYNRYSKYTEEWLSQGSADRVMARCQEAIAVDPDCAPAYKMLGNIYAAKGKAEKAIQWYEKALEKQPNQPETYINLGSIFARKKQFKLAGAYYQKALTLDPNLFVAYVNLAKIWQRFGKDREATDCLYRAGELQPHRFEAEQHLNLGNQLLKQQQLDRAIACYQRALKINPKLLGVYENLAEAYTRQGKTDEAKRYNGQVLQLRGTPIPDENRSDSGTGVIEKTEVEIVPVPSPQTRENNPTHRTHEETGDAYAMRGELDRAVLAYQQALELEPQAWQLYHKLGDVFQAGGKLYEALEAYDRATAIVTGDSSEKRQLE